MMDFNLLGGRRGVSPVIAVVLMVAVAVSIAVIVYAWSSGFVSERATSESAEAETLVVENVRLSGTTLTINIRNKSLLVAILDSIYVDGELRATGLSQSIIANGVTELNLSDIISSNGGDGNFSAGDRVQLVTRRGTQIRFRAK